MDREGKRGHEKIERTRMGEESKGEKRKNDQRRGGEIEYDIKADKNCSNMNEKIITSASVRATIRASTRTSTGSGSGISFSTSATTSASMIGE